MATLPDSDNRLILPEGSLVVFVDDTGHEALVPGHPVYGLGGCAVLSSDLDPIIRDPWRDVRRKVTGSPETPLHANAFAGLPTRFRCFGHLMRRMRSGHSRLKNLR